MSQSRMMEGNEAAAYGAMLARVQVVPAYPITPQTELISFIAQFIAEGKMKAEYIKVEGEHTAMAAAMVLLLLELEFSLLQVVRALYSWRNLFGCLQE
jgi:pyruvate/2-oxoacid:ferredoxin oxidoreductase alpha subunit